MSIFEVGGWAVKAAPVRETPQQRLSKKRKRPSGHSKIESAGVNVDELMTKLTQALPQTSTSTSSHNVEEYQEPIKKKLKQMYSRKGTSYARRGESIVPVEIGDGQSSPKGGKSQHQGDLRPSKKNSKQKMPFDTPLTLLQKGMKDSLDGARFRLVC
jgi:ribosomal RNA-processing protein 8